MRGTLRGKLAWLGGISGFGLGWNLRACRREVQVTANDYGCGGGNRGRRGAFDGQFLERDLWQAFDSLEELRLSHETVLRSGPGWNNVADFLEARGEAFEGVPNLVATVEGFIPDQYGAFQQRE